MLELVWLIPALPLAGFLLLLVAGRRIGDPWAGWLATAMVAGSFAATVVVYAGLLAEDGHDRHFTQTLFTWLPVGGLEVDLGFLVDPLSITMALFVTGVGALIHLYSIGYMHGDDRYPQFFLYLNLFAFSMLMLVLGDNFLVTFLGWEGVGACSYFLVAFWFERETAAVAGKKAFVTNRVGDFGFLLAMFLIFSTLGSLQYTEVLEQAGALPEVTATAIALLLFLGAAGKSAQLPLYVWLPDAMEGPTPVSALIHAATMVTSGVYLMARINPILDVGSDALTLIAWVGAATALFAATVAVAQNDIKRTLAYSTVSQLGYMFLALGVGAPIAAIFHLVTHAFFKALLFLGSGSVIHATEEQDMRRMGALRKWMPITAATFIIGWLAIAGVPPFAGFWSKDDILLNAWDYNKVLWGMGLFTALLTAFYMSRQVFMVFFGDPQWAHSDSAVGPAGGAGHTPEQAEATPEHEPAAAEGQAAPAHTHDHPAEPHEAPATMWIPLVALGGLSLVGGGLNLPFVSDLLLLEHWLEPVFEETLRHPEVATGAKVGLALTATIASLLGIVIAFAVYLQRRVEAERLEPEILARAWRVDEAFAGFFGGPGRAVSNWLTWFFDLRIIDGAVNGTAAGIREGASRIRTVQTGYVRSYALGVAGGAALLLVWFVTRTTG
ncbi:MAG: NADH-quinone oxidoreductase subunit L [Actinomycetota bacterium]